MLDQLTIEREARMPEAVLDDTTIASTRAKLGMDLRIGHSANNRNVTVRIAPPSWIICCFCGLQFGWPGSGPSPCLSSRRVKVDEHGLHDEHLKTAEAS